MTISAEVLDRVTYLLGREPRGLEAVAVAAADGEPMVIRVASLVDDKPFPTLFWLVDSDLSYRIDQAEAGGLIRQFQRRVDASLELQGQMRLDHQAHIALRASYLSAATLLRLDALGFGEVLTRQGHRRHRRLQLDSLSAHVVRGAPGRAQYHRGDAGQLVARASAHRGNALTAG